MRRVFPISISVKPTGLKILFYLLLGLPSLSWANAFIDHNRLEARQEKFWDKIIAQIKAGDKSFCEEKSRINMGTCARAFALQQKIFVAKEIFKVSDVFLAAMRADAAAKAMDPATIKIYATESLLKFRETLNYQNPYCELDKAVCDKENRFLKKAMPDVVQVASTAIPEMGKLIKENPASPATEKWRQEKIDYITKNYKKILVAPIAQQEEPTQVASKPTENKNDVAKEKVNTGPKESAGAQSQVKNVSTDIAKNMVRENAGLIKCLNLPSSAVESELKVVAENCIRASSGTSQVGNCIESKVTRLIDDHLSRVPAGEREAIGTCLKK